MTHQLSVDRFGEVVLLFLTDFVEWVCRVRFFLEVLLPQILQDSNRVPRSEMARVLELVAHFIDPLVRLLGKASLCVVCISLDLVQEATPTFYIAGREPGVLNESVVNFEDL